MPKRGVAHAPNARYLTLIVLRVDNELVNDLADVGIEKLVSSRRLRIQNYNVYRTCRSVYTNIYHISMFITLSLIHLHTCCHSITESLRPRKCEGPFLFWDVSHHLLLAIHFEGVFRVISEERGHRVCSNFCCSECQMSGKPR